jgi:hypothetical protein
MQTFSVQGIKRDWNKAYHLGAILEAGKGHFCHSVLFVRCLLRGKERGVGSQGEMNTGEAIKTLQQTRSQAGKRGQVTHGTRLVWNSFKSTLREPSKRREAVMDETTCAINRFRFVKLGWETLRRFLQIS